MAFTPSKNEKRQNSACNNGTILAFSENQRQSTFHSRRKAPFLPPKTARTAGRSGCSGAEKRQAFLLLRRLRLLSPPKTARRRSSSVLAAFVALPHGGATSGFVALGGYALGWVVKAAQTADTGATARNALPVTAASPSRAVHTSFPCPPAGQEKRASVHLLKSLLPEMPALLRLPRPASRRPSSRP